MTPQRAHALSGRAAILGVIAVAFAVKAVVLLQLGDHSLLQPHGDLDTARYVDLAKRVAAGGPLAVREPFYLSPLYVYFLAGVFSTGGSLLTARILQIVLGSLAVGLIYLVGREWFDRRVALLGAALLILTGFVTFSEVLILQSALDPFLVALSLYLVSRGWRGGARWPLAASGAALGLLALNRPNALVYSVIAAGLLGLASRGSETGARAGAHRRLLRGMVPVAVLITVLGANALRNYLASGEAILISSHGGLNFYIGNNAAATGTYQPVPGVSASVAGQVRDATRVAEAARGRPLSAGEVSRYFYEEALRWTGEHPGDAVKLTVRKAAVLLNRVDVPLNYSYAFYRDETALLRVLFVGPLLLFPLGLVGLIAGIPARRRADYWIWASFVPLYGLSVIAFFVSDRYRLPLLVPLALHAAQGLFWMADRVRRRELAPLLAPLAGVAAIAAIAAWDLGLDDGRGGERARYAATLIEQGSHDEARRYAATAARGLGYPGVFHFRVGEAFTSAGDYREAANHLRAARAIDGDQPAILLALGQALLLDGRAGEAVSPLRSSLDRSFRPEVSGPWLVRALAAAGRAREALAILADLSDAVVRACGPESGTEMATVALNLGAPAVAERWVRAVVEQAPASADAQEKLGVAYLLQGRALEALGPLETASRLAPEHASARLNLAVAYAALKRYPEARVAAREALRLDPSEPRAAALLAALR